MNVGNIAISNKKGQVVVPRQIREDLGIVEGVPLKFAVWGPGMYVLPMELTPKNLAFDNGAVLEILKRTQGSWSEETPKEKEMEAKRRKFELVASKKARNAW